MELQTDEDINDDILHVMKEDAEHGIAAIIAKYEEQTDTGQLAEAIEPCLSGLLTLSFVSKNRLLNKFKQTVFEFLSSVPNVTYDLSSYYEPRRRILSDLFRKKQPDACFPKLPYIWMEVSAGKNFLSELTDVQWWQILTWHLHGGFFPSMRVAAEAVVLKFLLSHILLPDSYKRTILDQTVRLWGKSTHDVFEARYRLYVEEVLARALEQLEKELEGFGTDIAAWVNRTPVEEMVEAVLKKPVMEEYRALIVRVCTELDELATHLPHFSKPTHISKRYKNEELHLHMRESFVSAKDFIPMFIDVLKAEHGAIKHYYRYISTK